MSYKCSIHNTTKPSFCKKYPSEIDAYYFESCQYIKNGKLVDSNLSEEEQQKYCMECGLCCFVNQQMIKNRLITTDIDDEWKNGGKCKYLIEEIK